jgi:hypothetical protein
MTVSLCEKKEHTDTRIGRIFTDILARSTTIDRTTPMRAIGYPQMNAAAQHMDMEKNGTLSSTIWAVVSLNYRLNPNNRTSVEPNVSLKR